MSGADGASRQPVTAGDFSIVVPVGGVSHAWPRTAASLARLNPQPAEIIAVIDGPDHALEATAAAIGATVLVLETRSGPARARNLGARTAQGGILFFVDSDIEAPADLVAHAARIFTTHRHIAAVIGSYDDAPGDTGFVSQYRNLLHHFVHQNARETASTFWAACGAVTRRAFDEVGGFDERWLEPSIEDIELGGRLVRVGHDIRLAKGLQVKHLKAWRLLDMLATDLWRRAVPWTELMLRDGRFVSDLNVKTSDRLSVCLAFIMLLALAAAWWFPLSIAVGAAALVALLPLNAGFFTFLASRRGILFAARAVPLYWLYLLVCGAGFGLGLARYLLHRRR